MRFLAAAFAVPCLITPAAAAPTFPALTGRVVDNAQVLSPSTEAGLTAKLAALEAKTSRQLVVVTLPSLQGYEISDYGYQLGRSWGIGPIVNRLAYTAVLAVGINALVAVSPLALYGWYVGGFFFLVTTVIVAIRR